MVLAITRWKHDGDYRVILVHNPAYVNHLHFKDDKYKLLIIKIENVHVLFQSQNKEIYTLILLDKVGSSRQVQPSLLISVLWFSFVLAKDISSLML